MIKREISTPSLQGSLLIFIPICVSAYLVLNLIKNVWRESKKQYKPNPEKTFEMLFEVHIKNVFVKQSIGTLSKIKTQTIKTLASKPSQPLLLVFLAPKDARSTAINMAKRLAQITLCTLGKTTKTWAELDNFILEGTFFSDLKSPWHFYETIKVKLEKENIVIITDFELIHPHSSAILTYLTKDLFFPSKEIFLYLIIEVPKCESINVAKALNFWSRNSLLPHFENELYQEILRCLYLRSCLIKAEDFWLMG